MTRYMMRWKMTLMCDLCKAGQEPVAEQILRRKWGWIGHILRKPASSTTRQALTWNPQGKRKRGQPRNCWRRDTEAELKQQGTNWSGMTRAAQNRVRWWRGEGGGGGGGGSGGRWPLLHREPLQWLPCQAPGIIGSALGLVGPVSVYCDWVRWKVWYATSFSVWQHVKLSKLIRPWDTLTCCWDVKQPTNNISPDRYPKPNRDNLYCG